MNTPRVRPTLSRRQLDDFLDAQAAIALKAFVAAFRERFAAGEKIGVWTDHAGPERFRELFPKMLKEIGMGLLVHEYPAYTAIRFTPAPVSAWASELPQPFPTLPQPPDALPHPAFPGVIHEEVRFETAREAIDHALKDMGPHHWVIRHTYAPCGEIMRLAPQEG